MKRISSLLIIILLLLLVALPCQAGEAGGITIVVSSRLKPYMQALQGFREGCGDIQGVQAQKTIQSCPINELVLSENPALSPEALALKIKADSPRLLIAIGSNALEALKQINDIPIVFMLVPNHETLVNGRQNITGIGMLIEPEQEIDALTSLLPTAKRIGLVYSKTFSKEKISRLASYAKKLGINLLAREAVNPKQGPKLISDMTGLIDLLWMVPDPALLTADTIEHMLLFSTEKRVPILTFSDKFLKNGASVAITLDPLDTGRQAARLAKKVHDKGSIAGQPVEAPRKSQIYINTTVVKKLNLSINPDFDVIEE